MSDQYNAGGYGPPMPPDPGMTVQRTGPPPPPVTMAVRLMFIQAALSVLGLIVLFATKNSLKSAIRDNNPGYDSKQLDDAVNAGIAVGAVIGIIFIILYVLLALQVNKGKNWARIVTWVLAALGVLGVLVSFAQPEPAISRVLGIIGGIIDVAIIVLLAQKLSNAFFRKQHQP